MSSQQNMSLTPTAEDLLELPRWARVAFAVRCGRRVQPLFTQFWPDAPATYVEAIEQALTTAASMARVPTSAHDTAIVSHWRAADAVAAAAPASPAALVAETAARAAEAASRAATARAGAPRAADAYAAARAADAAVAARTDGRADSIRAVWRDYECLLAASKGRLQADIESGLSREDPWTDETPVDASSVGPLWISAISESDLGTATQDSSSDAEVPVFEVLNSLRRWARVALAVRCAQRVEPLASSSYPGGTPDPAQYYAIRQVTLAAATACRTGMEHPSPDQDTQAIGYIRAGAVLADVIRAAVSALRAASPPDSTSAAGYANYAVSMAANAAKATNAGQPFIAAAWQDCRLLQILQVAHKWTDDTPLNPDSLGPLWPSGEPDGWPSPDDTADKLQLMVEVEVPSGATDDEIKKITSDIADRLDRLHRAYEPLTGGLTINRVELDQPAPVPQEVPA